MVAIVSAFEPESFEQTKLNGRLEIYILNESS